MRIPRFSVCLLACLTLMGCDQIAPQDKAQPAPVSAPTPAASPVREPVVATVPVDLSTPDRALRSYWAVRDEIVRALWAIQRAVVNKAVGDIQRAERQLPEVAVPAIVDNFKANIEPDPAETFSRDILEVKIESESRAVVSVVIKNTTPIPEGAVLTEFARELRRNGDRYRYVLENGATGWQVAEIWSLDSHTGMQKDYPRDTRPSAKILTYEGR